MREGILAAGKLYDVDEFVVLTICPTLESRFRSYELLAQSFELTPRYVNATAAE